MPDYVVKIKVRGKSVSDVKKQFQAALGGTISKQLTVALSSELPNYFEACQANDHFGCVHWTDEDLRNRLKELHVQVTPEIIDEIRASYAVRHIEDRMIERGWEAIEEAIGEAQVV